MKKIFNLCLFILFSTLTYSQQTSDDDNLSETALSYAKSGDFKMAEELYLKKIGNGNGTPNDYYNLGKIYYNLHDNIKADSILTIFNQLQPTHIQGYLWRARALVNLDPDTKVGKAKPIYEIILDKTSSDPVKFKKERIEALYYLAYYYYNDFKETKNKDSRLKSLEYCESVRNIDQNDPKAIQAAHLIHILK